VEGSRVGERSGITTITTGNYQPQKHSVGPGTMSSGFVSFRFVRALLWASFEPDSWKGQAAEEAGEEAGREKRKWAGRKLLRQALTKVAWTHTN